MRFTRISITKKEVALDWETKVGHGLITHGLVEKDRPLPAFAGALQAFAGFALALIGAPPAWDDGITVTTLNFHEDKNGRRGLQVSFSRRVDRARGASTSITTPVMWEADEPEGEIADGFYGTVVIDLIAALESEATKFQAGEREQAEMFDKTASADEGTTTRPRVNGKARPAKNAGTPGEVMNPGHTIKPDDEALRVSLLAAGRDMPVDAIASLGSNDRDKVQRWADGQARVRAGTLRADASPKEPLILKKLATPALSDEMVGAR